MNTTDYKNTYLVYAAPTTVKQVANRLRLALPDSVVVTGTEACYILSNLSRTQVALGLENESAWVNRNLRWISQRD
jgi:hypothetical protein